MVCPLLFCCRSSKEEPEVPEENPFELPCGCGDEWPPEEPVCQWVLAWDFPVKPGMAEWAQFKTYQERVDACQIPEVVLTQLSTEDLTEICLQYPFLFQVLSAYKTLDIGLDEMIEQFNGIRALYEREDAYKALLKRYRCRMLSMSYLYEPVTDAEKGRFINSISEMEVLLSRFQSPDATNDMYMEILQHLFCGHEKRIPYYLEIVDYDMFLYADPVNFFARAVILLKIDEQYLAQIPITIRGGNPAIPQERNEVFRRGLLDEPTWHIVNEISCNLINQ